jgi:hypothetical protein
VTIASSSSSETRLRHRFMRRWPIGFVGIVATGALCVAALTLVPPTFTAKAQVLLVPPPTAPSAKANGNPNPYLTLGGMQPLADVVARALTASATLTQLHRRGLTGSYTVLRDANTDGPILTVMTKDKSAVATLADLRLVLGTAQPQLDRLQTQQSVLPKDRVTATVVARDSAASASRKSQIRALVVAVVAGAVGTALTVSAVDVLLIRRANRRRIRRERSRASGSATRSARVRITPTEAIAVGPSTNARAVPAASSSQQRITTRSLARSRSLARLVTDRSDAQVGHAGETTQRAVDAADVIAVMPDNAEPIGTQLAAESRSPVGSSNGHATADAHLPNSAGEAAPVPIATVGPRLRRRVAIRPMMRSRVEDTSESHLNEDAEPEQGRHASRAGTPSR